MRLLSRHRTNLVEDLTRVKNRVQRILEDGNIKWTTVASIVSKLKEIPGFSDVLALGVIAEATDQMQNFEDERK
ncbi:MAG: hypothetical protein NTV34_15870 [Proteobacteria bacterium]|nr:hypothetical protein [Pseudomonadota bacterium]